MLLIYRLKAIRSCICSMSRGIVDDRCDVWCLGMDVLMEGICLDVIDSVQTLI